jgi:hypothetical protein
LDSITDYTHFYARIGKGSKEEEVGTSSTYTGWKEEEAGT